MLCLTNVRVLADERCSRANVRIGVGFRDRTSVLASSWIPDRSRTAGSDQGISGDEAMCDRVTASLSIERQARGGGDGCGLAGQWWSLMSSVCEIAAV